MGVSHFFLPSEPKATVASLSIFSSFASSSCRSPLPPPRPLSTFPPPPTVSANLIAKEDIVNLERGCVCCSLRSDLVDAFKELDRRSNSSTAGGGGGTKFDNVLVETTGVADPGPVVSFFFLWLDEGCICALCSPLFC